MWGRITGNQAGAPPKAAPRATNNAPPLAASQPVRLTTLEAAIGMPVPATSFVGRPTETGGSFQVARGVAVGAPSPGDAEGRCAQLQAKVAALEQKLKTACAERDAALSRVQELEDYLAPQLQRMEGWRQQLGSSPEAVRLRSRLAANVAKEMKAALEGRKLEKVNSAHGTLEVRQVAVSFEEMQLRWKHPDKGAGAQGQLGNLLEMQSQFVGGLTGGLVGGAFDKMLDLHTVTQLKYGHEVGLQGKFPEVSPWLCFSLETSERSFDFVAPDEYALRCFVLALSRARPDVPGAVPSRKCLLLRKARCKIEEACHRKGKSLARLMIEAHELKKSLLPPQATRKVPALGTAGLTRALSRHATIREEEEASRVRGSTNLEGIESFLLSSKSKSPPTNRGAWPKPGEVWIFTGVAAEVDIYKDKEGLEWANQVKCSDKAGRRSVTVLSAPETGAGLVEVRGNEKIKCVRGWLKVLDGNGAWVVERE